MRSPDSRLSEKRSRIGPGARSNAVVGRSPVVPHLNASRDPPSITELDPLGWTSPLLLGLFTCRVDEDGPPPRPFWRPRSWPAAARSHRMETPCRFLPSSP